MFKPNKIKLHLEINYFYFCPVKQLIIHYHIYCFLFYLTINLINLYIFPICNVFIWFLKI